MYLNNMCCLCLQGYNVSESSQSKYSSMKSESENGITYFDKISSSLTRVADMIANEEYLLCESCCQTVNMIYQYNEDWLKNLEKFSNYKLSLKEESNSENKALIECTHNENFVVEHKTENMGFILDGHDIFNSTLSDVREDGTINKKYLNGDVVSEKEKLGIKIENVGNCLVDSEILIKTEPLDETSELQIQTNKICQQIQIKTEIIEPIISECISIKDDISDNDNDTALTEKPTVKRKRQPNREWTKTAEFDTAEDADNYISSQEIWKVASSRKTSEGFKVEYRCNRGKYRANECPARLLLLYHSDELKVSLYQTSDQHDNHDNTSSRGLDHDIKCFIKEQYNSGYNKPNSILRLLRENNFTVPPKVKVICFLKSLRNEKNSDK